MIGRNTATYETAIDVPPCQEEQLSASSLILADVMERVATRVVSTGQFVIGGMKVRPRVTGIFKVNEKLGIYIQLYHLENASIEYQITSSANGQPVLAYSENVDTPTSQATIQRWLPLKDFAPGSYTLRMKVSDKARNQTITPFASFSVAPDPHIIGSGD